MDLSEVIYKDVDYFITPKPWMVNLE